MVWTWAAIAVAAVVAILTSVAAVAIWQRPRASGPGEVEQLLTDAGAVRAAAERAAEAAEEARLEAERSAGARDQAEDRYLEARWEARVATADEAQLLVQRAALAAYRRGELSVEQLNGIWHHAGPPAEQLDDGRVRDAKRAYEAAVAETVQSREQVHVASVAAEVLVEEARNAEVDVLEAWEAREAARPTLDKLFQEENA
ncbi:hypothetical protein Q0Z83_004170 [Actinoplanes sichuanensis]|uniref:Secreted protein n=1 Tax=Actinoplanes sichuanensis TaxID=512349 RepID=A0ABW4AI40_9ACTN|nr:hypothetical protein [Actinoplanes sichuanensis]BEL02226.1 hypothetical protein Q0Z83_004170 [Actinoplanes sichuanensis]